MNKLLINVNLLYTTPLNTSQVNDKCTACFKRTSLSSSGAIHPPTKVKARLASAFVRGCIAPDEERLILLKPVVQFSCVKRYFIFAYTLITSLFIYYETRSTF